MSEAQQNAGTETVATESAQQTAATSSVSTAPQSAAATTGAPVSSPVQGDQSAAVAAAVQQAIDYKFKYRDESADKVEGEIDEWARGFITKDNEQKFKEIWAKAHGLDFVKNRFSKVRDEYKDYRGQVDPLIQGWNTLTELYNRGDMESFFKGLQIPEEKIFKYVLEKLEYSQLPPEERAARDQRSQVLRQNVDLERKNQLLEQHVQQQQVASRTQELDVAMAKPEVQAVASAFDARVGRPGAFKDEVIKRGVLAWHTSQQDIPAEQAIAEVLQIIGTPAQTATPATAQTAPQAAMAAQSVAPQIKQAPPVLPNVGAKNSSPTKRGPKSLDEIRKLAASMG